SMPDTLSLTSINASIHETLDQALLTVVEALLELDMARAQSHFGAFVAALADHAEREERDVFPHCSGLEVPRNGSVEIVERDHALLDKRVADVGALIESLAVIPGAERRSHLARSLGPIVRLQAVLEHHSEREIDLLYPAIDAQIDVQVRRAMAAALQPER